MSLELCVLGSGSSGNASILRSPNGAMLIDAGLGPRTIAQRLNGTGVQLADLQAICLTHLDSDHCCGPAWLATILKSGITVYCHSQRINDLIRILCDRDEFHPQKEAARKQIRAFGRSTFSPLPDVTFTALPLAHDRTGSHAFVVEGFGRRIGFATDLGRVPTTLVEQFADLDVIALESNYDPQMQLASGRPEFLQRRIMDGSGHLSNEQAFEAIRQMLDRHERAGRGLPEHIVLLHRSRQCNCPNLMRRVFTSDARVAPRLVVTEQYARTEWLRPTGTRPRNGEQLTLFAEV